MLRIALLRRFLLLAPLALCAGVAHAWPDRPITLIVPFSAGGPTDTIGRILAESMSRTLGKTIVVENVTGAGGTIANARVIKSPPDGYTIMIGHVGTHVFAPAVQALNVDYLHDFDPVALVATNPEVIVSRNDVPANSLQELIAWVKASPPGTVSFASGGAGTPSHIMAVQFGQLVAPLNIVHYRGAAPAMFLSIRRRRGSPMRARERFAHMPSPRRTDSRPPQTSPPLTKQGCPASTCQSGTASGRRAAPRRA